MLSAAEKQEEQDELRQQCRLILKNFPPHLRERYMVTVNLVLKQVYSGNESNYRNKFWNLLELQLPWQRELRIHLNKIDGIGSSTINRLFRMAHIRSPEAYQQGSSRFGKPSIRGWASIAETIREYPEGVRDISVLLKITPLTSFQLRAVRAEIASWT